MLLLFVNEEELLLDPVNQRDLLDPRQIPEMYPLFPSSSSLCFVVVVFFVLFFVVVVCLSVCCCLFVRRPQDLLDPRQIPEMYAPFFSSSSFV